MFISLAVFVFVFVYVRVCLCHISYLFDDADTVCGLLKYFVPLNVNGTPF